MSENSFPSTSSETESVVSNVYDQHRDTQEYLINVHTKKVRNYIFIIAGIFLFQNLISILTISSSDIPSLILQSTIIVTVLIFACFIGLAFLANKQPMVAIAITAAIIAILWAILIMRMGGAGIFSGWLFKAITIYLIIAGFQSANEVKKAKQELGE